MRRIRSPFAVCSLPSFALASSWAFAAAFSAASASISAFLISFTLSVSSFMSAATWVMAKSSSSSMRPSLISFCRFASARSTCTWISATAFSMSSTVTLFFSVPLAYDWSSSTCSANTFRSSLMRLRRASRRARKASMRSSSVGLLGSASAELEEEAPSSATFSSRNSLSFSSLSATMISSSWISVSASMMSYLACTTRSEDFRSPPSRGSSAGEGAPASPVGALSSCSASSLIFAFVSLTALWYLSQ
mmetsp:Transcript_7363/g.19839  ORF Transcript_7363/g.19839 Transcript_7363/m.19839 type:complete len:248 (-) Transcript_7363:483-1226(-)